MNNRSMKSAVPRIKCFFTVLISSVPISALLFTFFFSIYALTNYGQIRYGDEEDRYLQAQSLVERRSFEIRQMPSVGEIGVGGWNYSKYELGYGLALIPPYVVGRAVSEFFPYVDRDWIPILFVTLTNTFINALACVILFWFGRALGMRDRVAAGVAVIFGLGTLAWPYSKGLYREPLQGLTLLVSVYALYVYRITWRNRWFWLAAAAAGYLVFTKIANLGLIPFLLVYLGAVLNRMPHSINPRLHFKLAETIKGWALFLIPTILFLGLQGVVNSIKYGNVFMIGSFNYGNPQSFITPPNMPTGVWGLIASPNKSIIFYAPPVILFPFAWVTFFRRHRAEAVLVLLLVIANTLLNGSFRYWFDGSFWGPRYMAQIVPLMILPLGVWLESVSDWRKRFLWIVSAVIFLAGLFVQVVGALVDDREFLDTTQRFIDVMTGFDYLRHGAIASLTIYLAPEGLPVMMNTYGWVLIGIAILSGLGILLRLLSHTNKDSFGGWHVVLASVAPITFLLLAFVTWVVADYPNVLAQNGDTKYVAGNAYFAEGGFCEAKVMYLFALYFGTNYMGQSVARLEEIAPRARGKEVELGGLLSQIMKPEMVQVEQDSGTTVESNSSLRISAPPGIQVTAESDSDFISVRPNTSYELSGWLKTEGVGGNGYAVVAWYEDNGDWGNRRDLDVARMLGTRGWQPFRRTITTLPTTQRILLKSVLWQAYGNMWTDGIHLVELGGAETASITPLCTE